MVKQMLRELAKFYYDNNNETMYNNQANRENATKILISVYLCYAFFYCILAYICYTSCTFLLTFCILMYITLSIIKHINEFKKSLIIVCMITLFRGIDLEKTRIFLSSFFTKHMIFLDGSMNEISVIEIIRISNDKNSRISSEQNLSLLGTDIKNIIISTIDYESDGIDMLDFWLHVGKCTLKHSANVLMRTIQFVFE
jgi:hypothetical protein